MAKDTEHEVGPIKGLRIRRPTQFLLPFHWIVFCGLYSRAARPRDSERAQRRQDEQSCFLRRPRCEEGPDHSHWVAGCGRGRSNRRARAGNGPGDQIEDQNKASLRKMGREDFSDAVVAFCRYNSSLNVLNVAEAGMVFRSGHGTSRPEGSPESELRAPKVEGNRG